MEDEWNKHVSDNMGAMISDYMDTNVTRSMLADIEEEEEECDTECCGDNCSHNPQSPNVKKCDCCHKDVSEAQKRKDTPVFSGVLKYFPNALKEVSKCSKAGNDQHHPDKPLHWDMNKSKDEYDALTRHLIDHTINPMDDDGILHLTKVAWRALAGLERYLTDNH
tara:strand:- start:501 stop:995 length:495 start_codon:yes stop_codon:yes gene_type:complete